MIEVRETEVFTAWFEGLRDDGAIERILGRVNRLRIGNFGDVRPVGKGVSELRIDYGPGYRLYFVRRGTAVVILLCGSDKRAQTADIKRAIEMAKEV
jgi:putative addiction module killer protein